jgi:exopolysaccharide production protein ExoZ
MRLGPYEIVALLGTGGMGHVYRAIDTRLGRAVAVKVLPDGLAVSLQTLERSQREARAASALSHPNICTIFDGGTDQPFIAMELLEGETLEERLGRGRMDLGSLLDVGLGVADALGRGAQQGHRPPRHQAGEHLHHGAWTEGAGLRPREVVGRRHDGRLGSGDPLGRRAVDRSRQRRRNGRLYVAGAGPRDTAGRTHGPVLVRCRALRDGDGGSTVSRRKLRRHPRLDSSEPARLARSPDRKDSDFSCLTTWARSALPVMLLNLYLLRAIAALGVVYFHTTSEAGLNLPVSVGSHGVDVFFVISGFIIAYIGARSPDRFLTRRLIRIVPFYWTATLAVFGVAVLAPHILRSTQADYVQLLYSLFFIPHETAHAAMVPTLILGWSLNYEMYFYVLFALALAIAPRRAPVLCALGIIATALLLEVSGISHPSVRFYARPLVFEFVYGVCVYYLLVAAERHIGWYAQRPGIRWGLWVAALSAALSIGVEEAYGGFGLPRFLSAGVPAFVLVLAALLLERMYGVMTKSNIVLVVGESSYILYLIHPYVIYGVLRTAFSTHAELSLPATIALVIALPLVSTVVAVAIHVWFERPVLTSLRRSLLRSVDASGSREQHLALRPAHRRLADRILLLDAVNQAAQPVEHE